MSPSYPLILPGGLQRVFAVICDVFGSCTDPFVFNVNVSSVPIVPDAVNQMLDKLAFSGDVSSLLLYAASKSQDVSAQSNKSLSGRRLLAFQDVQSSIVSKVSAAISENAKSFDANAAKDALQSLAKVVADPSMLSSQSVSLSNHQRLGCAERAQGCVRHCGQG